MGTADYNVIVEQIKIFEQVKKNMQVIELNLEENLYKRLAEQAKLADCTLAYVCVFHMIDNLHWLDLEDCMQEDIVKMIKHSMHVDELKKKIFDDGDSYAGR